MLKYKNCCTAFPNKWPEPQIDFSVILSGPFCHKVVFWLFQMLFVTSTVVGYTVFFF